MIRDYAKAILDLLTIALFIAGGYFFAQLGSDHVLEARQSFNSSYAEVQR